MHGENPKLIINVFVNSHSTWLCMCPCLCVGMCMMCVYFSWRLNHLTNFNEELPIYQLISDYFPRILLILYGKLSKIPDYLTVPILTKVSTHNFFVTVRLLGLYN